MHRYIFLYFNGYDVVNKITKITKDEKFCVYGMQ